MATPKKYPLSVAFNVPLVDSVKRKAVLIKEENGYQYIRYEGEKESVKVTGDNVTDLLCLIPAFQEFQGAEKWKGIKDPLDRRAWNHHEINPEKIVKFLNRWGMIGTSTATKNIQRVQVNANTDFAIAHALGFYVTPLEAKRLVGGSRFSERFGEILNLNEIPLPWIEEELRTLAWITRLVINILHDPHFYNRSEREEIKLNRENRKRIISANYHHAVFAFEDGKDPATSRKKLTEEWTEEALNDAEKVLDSFAGELNRYLAPLTVSVVRTEKTEEFYRRNLGFETAYASDLLNAMKNGSAFLICQECEKPYFPKRVRQDAKYCGTRCSGNARAREWKRENRARLKVSASKAGKKKTQGKKGE